jgi:DNA-binding MarR family transcriptional regulator
MNALDLIVLGRQLTKIGEEVLRGSPGSAGKGVDGRGEQAEAYMPTGASLVLRDVFVHPDSSITDITARTGLPQSYVSESVARLRGQGILETSPDPGDGRRTLVRVSAQHPRTVAAKGAASVDGALAAALGEAENGPGVAEIIATLAALAERLRPESPGPIRRQLDQARREP